MAGVRVLAARTPPSASISGHSQTLHRAASRISCASMPAREQTPEAFTGARTIFPYAVNGCSNRAGSSPERRLFARPPREWPTTLCDRYRAGVRGRINRGSARGAPGDCQPARRTCTPALAALAATHFIAGYERAILASSPHTCRACSTPRRRQLRERQIPDDWPASSPPCSARPDLACIAVP